MKKKSLVFTMVLFCFSRYAGAQFYNNAGAFFIHNYDGIVRTNFLPGTPDAYHQYAMPVQSTSGKKAMMQRHDSLIYEKYNNSTNAYDKNVMNKYIYNARGQVLTAWNQVWSAASSQWANGGKTEYQYDAPGRLMTQTTFDWIAGSSSYQNSYKMEHFRDAAGRDTVMIAFVGQSGSSTWVPYQKHLYTYDGQGNQTMDTYSIWDSGSSTWVLSGRSESTYNASNANTSYVTSNWMKPTSTWIYYRKSALMYDANGNQTRGITLNWNQGTNAWDTFYRFDNTFDVSNNNTVSEILVYSAASGWSPYSKTMNSFNNAYAKNDIIWPGGANLYNHLLLTYENEQFAGGSYAKYDRGTCYYSAVNIAGVGAYNATDELLLYPNPTSGLVSLEGFRFVRVALFDLSGKQVFEQLGNNNSSVLNLQALANGMYILQATRVHGETINRKIEVAR